MNTFPILFCLLSLALSQPTGPSKSWPWYRSGQEDSSSLALANSYRSARNFETQDGTGYEKWCRVLSIHRTTDNGIDPGVSDIIVRGQALGYDGLYRNNDYIDNPTTVRPKNRNTDQYNSFLDYGSTNLRTYNHGIAKTGLRLDFFIKNLQTSNTQALNDSNKSNVDTATNSGYNSASNFKISTFWKSKNKGHDPKIPNGQIQIVEKVNEDTRKLSNSIVNTDYGSVPDISGRNEDTNTTEKNRSSPFTPVSFILSPEDIIAFSWTHNLPSNVENELLNQGITDINYDNQDAEGS